jgi:hypothetical protein
VFESRADWPGGPGRFAVQGSVPDISVTATHGGLGLGPAVQRRKRRRSVRCYATANRSQPRERGRGPRRGCRRGRAITVLDRNAQAGRHRSIAALQPVMAGRCNAGRDRGAMIAASVQTEWHEQQGQCNNWPQPHHWPIGHRRCLSLPEQLEPALRLTSRSAASRPQQASWPVRSASSIHPSRGRDSPQLRPDRSGWRGQYWERGTLPLYAPLAGPTSGRSPWVFCL